MKKYNVISVINRTIEYAAHGIETEEILRVRRRIF